MGWATVAMAGVQALGSIINGAAASKTANYNAKIAENNAKIATQNADWAGAEGDQKAGIAGLQSKDKQGAIKTAQAANNVDVNSGSALAVQQSERQAGQLNIANIRSNAARQAFGYETQSAGYTAQAAMDRAQGRNAKTAGYIGGITNLVKGAGAYAMYSGGGDGLSVTQHADNPVSTPGYPSFLSQSGGSNWDTQQNSNSLF